MKKVVSKKGLSPVVATVLLIMLVLIIAAIIFLWARGFFTEQIEKNGESIDIQCGRVDLDIDLPEGYGGSSCDGAGGTRESCGGLLTIDVVNNGDISVYGLSVREASGGSAQSQFFLMNLNSGSAQRLEISLKEVNDLDKVSFYPVLLGSVVGGDSTNKEYTCVQSPIEYSV